MVTGVSQAKFFSVLGFLTVISLFVITSIVLNGTDEIYLSSPPSLLPTGRDIVDFLESTLSKNIAQELAHVDDASVATRIERSFLLTDIQSRKANLLTSGATVVICLVKKCPSSNTASIHAANVGDARAVLSCSTTAKDDKAIRKTATRLTFDHRADVLSENDRIEAAGGFIHQKRVLGILAVTRSLGDHGLKDYVIARPHISEVKVKDAAGEFVIVACDGLWDVFDDQKAVDFVREALNGPPSVSVDKRTGKQVTVDPKETVAEMLVEEALKRGSTDNITAIVAWL